jgi:hypothetical protein
MKLLVSTPLQIFLLDTVSKEKVIVRCGDGYYFGITHKQNVIVLSHSGGYLQYYSNSNVKPLQTKNHLIQPHQIEWIGDHVFVTNTGKNCISIYDSQGNLFRDLYLNDIHWDDKDHDRAGNHFNSVHKINQKIYIVAHNYARPSEVYELSWPDLTTLNKIVTNASWAHNLMSYEHGLIICNSKSQSLFDIHGGRDIWRADEPGAITRGLAASKDYFFVGQSNYAERKERYWKTGGVWIVDRNSLKTVDKITLPGSGDVQEIRILDELDDGHNGEIIPFVELANITRKSPSIALAYELRSRYPLLQKNIFPFSQIVRTAQMTWRWRRTFNNKLHGL